MSKNIIVTLGTDLIEWQILSGLEEEFITSKVFYGTCEKFEDHVVAFRCNKKTIGNWQPMDGDSFYILGRIFRIDYSHKNPIIWLESQNEEGYIDPSHIRPVD